MLVGMEKKKFALIGCGTIAERHANAIQQVGKLIAVYDVNIGSAINLAKSSNCDVINDLTALLNIGVDVVSICTPNWLHATQSILCLNAGLNVVCEKPMAIRSVHAHEMIEVAQRNNKQLFVVKQLRQYPNLIWLKDWLDEIGQEDVRSFEINCLWTRDSAYYTEWRGKIKTDGGTLYTQFSHYIDLLIWMFGEVDVFEFKYANQQHAYIEFEDCGSLSFRMKSGVTGTFNYSVNAKKDNVQNSMQVATAMGTIKLSGNFLEKLESAEIIFPTFDYSVFKKSESHYRVYDEVNKALHGLPNTATNGFDSIQSIELIEKIYQTMRL